MSGHPDFNIALAEHAAESYEACREWGRDPADARIEVQQWLTILDTYRDRSVLAAVLWDQFQELTFHIHDRRE